MLNFERGCFQNFWLIMDNGTISDLHLILVILIEKAFGVDWSQKIEIDVLIIFI